MRRQYIWVAKSKQWTLENKSNDWPQWKILDFILQMLKANFSPHFPLPPLCLALFHSGLKQVYSRSTNSKRKVSRPTYHNGQKSDEGCDKVHDSWVFQQQVKKAPQVQSVRECLLITAALPEDTLDKEREWETASPLVRLSVWQVGEGETTCTESPLLWCHTYLIWCDATADQSQLWMIKFLFMIRNMGGISIGLLGWSQAASRNYRWRGRNNHTQRTYISNHLFLQQLWVFL